MTIVTLSVLTNTLTRLLKVGRVEARKYAQVVINFFGFEDCILDNLLTPEERRLFYRLERHGIVSSVREETTLHNGNPWRIHYWRLERKRILEGFTSIQRKKPSNPLKNYQDLYATISTDMWSERRHSHI